MKTLARMLTKRGLLIAIALAVATAWILVPMASAVEIDYNFSYA